jgi:hypothetical protein
MRSWLKFVLALALVLPLGAFVAGSLVASAADEPAPRDTIVLDDSGSTPSGQPSPSPSPSPSATADDSDEAGHSGDDDDVEGVDPSYGEVDDDDHSGPGGGGDDGDHGDDGGGDDDDHGRGGGDD